jgi:C4-dicarboxylate-binding protein DctP
MQHFKERVEARSGGAIRIEIYDSGKLYDSHDVVAAVTSGKIEMGHVNLTRYAGTVPAADFFSLPFLFADQRIEKAARTPGSEIRQIIEEEILRHSGARVLWWIPEGSFVMLASGLSLANPAMLEGKTVRSSGPTTADTLRLCGGHPKEIAATKQPEAYKTNEVEIGMTSITAVLARKLFLFKNTITKTNLAYLNDVVVINDNVLNSLSASQQDILASVASEADIEASHRIVDFEDGAYTELTSRGGAQVVTLSPDDLLLWRICSGDVLSNFMETAGEQGRRLIAAYAKLLQNPCCLASEKP